MVFFLSLLERDAHQHVEFSTSYGLSFVSVTLQSIPGVTIVYIKPGTFHSAAAMFCFAVNLVPRKRGCFAVRFCCCTSVHVLYVCYNGVYIGLVYMHELIFYATIHLTMAVSNQKAPRYLVNFHI